MWLGFELRSTYDENSGGYPGALEDPRVGFLVASTIANIPGKWEHHAHAGGSYLWDPPWNHGGYPSGYRGPPIAQVRVRAHWVHEHYGIPHEMGKETGIDPM